MGQTGSGKTTLLKQIALKAKNRGRPIIVATSAHADPHAWPWASAVVTDGQKLADLMLRTAGAFVAVDEAGQVLGRQASILESAILTARHRGHTVAISAQRAVLVSRTVRDQTARLFCFRVGVDDSKELARQYGQEKLLQAPKLARGSFFSCSQFEAPTIFKLF